MAPLGEALYSSPYSTTAHLYDYNTKENDHDDYIEKARRVSENTAISSIPPSLPSDDLPQSVHRKHRPPFRSPSSVRALQLSSPEPGSSPRHLNSDVRRLKWSMGAVHNMSVAEDSDVESYTADGESEILQHMMAQKRQEKLRHLRNDSQHTVSEATVDTMQQPPLVLLHITILPSIMRYSASAMETLAPTDVLDNMRLLNEKLNDIVYARGVLISHPCDEYDVMEERLLEALELVTPRISPCGHFLGDEPDSFLDDSDFAEVPEQTREIESGDQQQAICNYAHADRLDYRSSSRFSDEDVCATCDEPMRNPYRGAGHGKKRWEVNFYAANGLMRAGAWAAAWREMERVDVEISPWIPHETKRDLETATRVEEANLAREKQEQDQKTAELQQELNATTQRAYQLSQDVLQLRDEMERLKKDAEVPILQAQSYETEEKVMSTRAAPLTEAQKQQLPKVPITNRKKDEIPVSRLLMRYVWLLAQDKRNVAIAAVFSVMVLLLNFYLASDVFTHVEPQFATIETNLASMADQAITTMSSLVTTATSASYQVSLLNGS